MEGWRERETEKCVCMKKKKRSVREKNKDLLGSTRREILDL